MAELRLFRGPDADCRAIDSLPARTAVRAPHYTASTRAILGHVFRTEKGWRLQPGELSLAGSGVLLLTDLPEFRRETIEALGRALREGLSFPLIRGERLHVSLGSVRLVATAHDCPCGMSRDVCRCTVEQRKRFNDRVEAFAWELQRCAN